MSHLFFEFGSERELLAAISALKAERHELLEVYSPIAVSEADEALGRRPSGLPRLVLAVGLGVAAATYALQWLLNAYLYPLDVGGRPPHFPLSFIPIAFEMGILGASFAAFFGVLARGKMLTLSDPVRDLDALGSASEDGYWIELRATDSDAIRAHARALGARRVEVLEDAP